MRVQQSLRGCRQIPLLGRCLSGCAHNPIARLGQYLTRLVSDRRAYRPLFPFPVRSKCAIGDLIDRPNHAIDPAYRHQLPVLSEHALMTVPFQRRLRLTGHCRYRFPCAASIRVNWRTFCRLLKPLTVLCRQIGLYQTCFRYALVMFLRRCAGAVFRPQDPP